MYRQEGVSRNSVMNTNNVPATEQSFKEVRYVYRGRVKGQAIPVQAWTGPKGSRRLRLPGFKTIGT
jgi:hypothetical protein